MQNIATSQLNPALQLVRKNQFYATSVSRLMHELSLSPRLHAANCEPTSKSQLVILISTDKGLCGALNQNVFRAIDSIDPSLAYFVTLGTKGGKHLSKSNVEPVASFRHEQYPTYENCAPLSRFCLKFMQSRQISTLSILSPHYISNLNIHTELRQILPIAEVSSSLQPTLTRSFSSQLHEPNIHCLLNKLLPTYVHSQCYEALLNARLSEISSRMVAMKQATDNAEDLIVSLTRQYNKIRQQTITNSIIEITTAQQDEK